MALFSPRPYQEEDLQKMRDAYDRGENRILYHAATGLGKGVTASFLPERFPRLMEHGMLVVVPRREIAFQLRDNFSSQVPGAKIGIEMASHFTDGDEDIIIATNHTLGRRESERIHRMMRSFGIIVNDEAHHAYKSGTVDNVLSWFGQGSEVDESLPSGADPLVVHMTATPERNDDKSIAPFCDYALPSRDIKFGVENGWLVDIDAHKITEDASAAHVADDMEGYEADLIVKAYEEFGLGKRLLGFAPSVAAAKLAARRFEERGIGAGFVSGEECWLRGEEAGRDDVIEAHKAGDIQIITNFGVLTEGYDDAGLQGLLMARNLSSERLYTQIMGRALRPSVDVDSAESAKERRDMIAESEKPAAHVVDVGKNAEELDLQITCPDVLGLDRDTLESDDVGEGDDDLVFDVVDTVDELDEDQPERDLREAGPEEIELAAQGVDIWSQTVYNDGLKRFATLRWVKWGDPPQYALYVPEPPSEESHHHIDNRKTIVYLRPSGEEGETYEAIEVDTGGSVKTRNGWRGTHADARQLTTMSKGEVGDYIRRVERKLWKTSQPTFQHLRHSFGQATEHATDEQLDELEDAGFSVERGEVTKLTAKMLLEYNDVADKIDAIRSGEQGTNTATEILS